MRQFKSFFIFLLAFILIGVLFEVLLSFGGILIPVVQIDPNKGERYCPNKMCCSIFVSEGFGLAETNAQGWFGKEFKYKSANDISVTVIGNSFVASRQVFYRNNFLSIAEKKTNEKLPHGMHTSFYNFGKEDLPLKELLYVKEDIAATYHPDYILILLNPGSFNVESQRYVTYYDYIDGKFKLDTSFKLKSFVKNFNKFEVLTKSSVLFLGYRFKNHLPQAGEILFDKFYYRNIPVEDQLETVDSLDYTDKAIITELAKDSHVIFLLNLEPAIFSKVKSLIGNSSFIDIYTPLKKMQNEKGFNPYYWEIPNKIGHWNIPAHKLIGEEIAKQMIEILHPNKTF